MESAHLLPWFGHFLATIVALVSTPETVGWSFELLYRSFEAYDLVYDSSTLFWKKAPTTNFLSQVFEALTILAVVGLFPARILGKFFSANFWENSQEM